jgi:hypothetical protein
LSPIIGVRQIYGHTPANEPRRLHDHLCLDTNMGHGPQHYAVVEDGKVTVRTLQNPPTP